MSLFRAIPRTRKTETKIVNAEQQAVYTYDINPVQLETMNAEVRTIINNELLETQTDIMPLDWWFQPEVELPVRQGTLEEINRFNQLIAAAVVAGVTVRGLQPQRVAPEVILSSRPYLEELRNVYVENFAKVKGLSDFTSSQVIDRINNGMKSGLTPTAIAKDINKRFSVSASNAKKLADKEVNRAYTNSKMRAVDMVAAETGLRAGVIHISALSATTRPPHAARHGLAYTTADQRQWWDRDGNRDNCKCSVLSVLIDSQGNVVQKEEQEEIKAERRV